MSVGFVKFPTMISGSRSTPPSGRVRAPREWRSRKLVIETGAESSARKQRSVVRVVPPVRPRKLAKVPFLELADGRLQGVVSSGSDIRRVYVSSIAAGSHDRSCSTNNNRPCGGLGYGMCKHLQALVKEATVQYGAERVARYLGVELADDDRPGTFPADRLGGRRVSAPAAPVFSRFLHHLAYLDRPAVTAPIPELHWFPATGEARP
ncbi:hypothetical protein SAMN04489764_4750 [Thermostaphylospora chromogena]|uniref:SWIM-type domain-containing protein n=1 Tax=Thermostaphylospora chromogena TaxID=35622 RepID=A0A1H1HRX4_9ACTN|nr:hypothetical protein SAMN04489764_4750 [Thermostaphylospora chromogena]